ncbi:MAG: carbohydrate ABC transporter permease [Reyranella sp.]|nr:carbohydrate ABC transporter permease [Reyranella sp.]MDP3161220.1 carbohydrate ABC transporter permease [Reyranella sp.]
MAARRRQLAHLRSFTILTLGAVIMLAPYVVMLSTSLKSQEQLFAATFQLIPSPLHWKENFSRALLEVPLGRFMLNGVVVCAGILVVQVLTAVPCAYVLAKIDFRGRETLFAIVLAALLIPHQVTAIPVYVVLASGNLLDTFLALIAPFSTSAFAIFLFRQFFRGIPDDLVNAARVDGMSEWTIVWRVIMPLAYPAITAFSIFSIVAHWNDLFWPMVVVTTPEMSTPPLGVLFFRDQESGGSQGALMAGTVIITAPLILAFLFAQKKFIDGLTMTGLKG